MWDKLLWGIEFKGAMPGDTPILIGTAWVRPPMNGRYSGEPTRAMLFNTRREAREWCSAKMAEYAGRSDCCKKWRFRPVRVRETVMMWNVEVMGACAASCASSPAP